MTASAASMPAVAADRAWTDRGGGGSDLSSVPSRRTRAGLGASARIAHPHSGYAKQHLAHTLPVSLLFSLSHALDEEHAGCNDALIHSVLSRGSLCRND